MEQSTEFQPMFSIKKKKEIELGWSQARIMSRWMRLRRRRSETVNRGQIFQSKKEDDKKTSNNIKAENYNVYYTFCLCGKWWYLIVHYQVEPIYNIVWKQVRHCIQ